jgi:RHS repeat-associated protein
MAGDKVNFQVKSWYKLNGTSPGNPNNLINNLVNLLATAIGGLPAAKGSYNDLIANNALNPGLNSYLTTSNSAYNSNKPKAFVNWVLLDEQFNHVSAGSGFEQVGDDNQLTPHSRTNLTMPSSGYLYIYVSNETPNISVFFDNLQVSHVHGPMLEETHYYPFGLTMAGISSKALNGAAENKFKYNGIEQNSDFDLNVYDAFYRNLDPQIGKFWQQDPEAESLSSYTPYESMGNDPIGNVDPLGDFRTRFGAWLHKVFNGGGDVGKNEFGEWFVRKTETSYTDEGGPTVTVKVTYGNGRDRYSKVRDELVSDMNVSVDVFLNGDRSLYKMYDSPSDAGWGAATIGPGLATPNPVGRMTTVAVNAHKLAREGKRIAEKIKKVVSVQKQARHLLKTAKNGGGYLNSLDDAQKVLDAVHSGEAVYIGTNNAGHPVFSYYGVTGTNVNLGAGIIEQPTNLFMIKGTSSPSVVPISPAWLPR